MSYPSATSESRSVSGTGFVGLLFGRSMLDRLPDLWAWVVGVVLLAPRFFLAIPFWNAGQVRLDNWGFQAILFQNVHPLPLLSPTQAAYLTTTFELALPVLLVIGLFGRFAALGLAVMAATIYFVIGGSFAIASEQFPWMAVGIVLFVIGTGRVSVDYLIRKKVLGE